MTQELLEMLHKRNGDPGLDEPLQPMTLNEIDQLANKENLFENYFQDPGKAAEFTCTLEKTGSIYIDLGKGSDLCDFEGFISSLQNAHMLVKVTLTFWSQEKRTFVYL